MQRIRVGMIAALTAGVLVSCSPETERPTGSGASSVLPDGAARSSSPADSGTSIPYRAEIVARDLNVPWDMDMAEDGRIFFTERPGSVRVIASGKLAEDPVITFPAPFLSTGEGGLLGLALDPDFARNGYLYVYHSYQDGDSVKNRVLRLKEEGGKAFTDKVLIDGIPGDTNHNGGRLRFGPDGLLYITAGDRYEPPLAQDRQSLGGKILRITRDGAIPETNPFPGSAVYSYGHRNPQGLAWHPGTGKLYASEHGQSAKDEINLIEAGANYGWPEMEGDESGESGGVPFRNPLLHSGETTWAPSGMTFVSRGPWQGSLLVACLRGQQVLKVSLDGPEFRTVGSVEPLFHEKWGRIRSVFEGPDGSLYLLTNNRDGRGRPAAEDDRMIRLIPAP